jgi:hypothetical protein
MSTGSAVSVVDGDEAAENLSALAPTQRGRSGGEGAGAGAPPKREKLEGWLAAPLAAGGWPADAHSEGAAAGANSSLGWSVDGESGAAVKVADAGGSEAARAGTKGAARCEGTPDAVGCRWCCAPSWAPCWAAH